MTKPYKEEIEKADRDGQRDGSTGQYYRPAPGEGPLTDLLYNKDEREYYRELNDAYDKGYSHGSKQSR